METITATPANSPNTPNTPTRMSARIAFGVPSFCLRTTIGPEYRLTDFFGFASAGSVS